MMNAVARIAVIFLNRKSLRALRDYTHGQICQTLALFALYCRFSTFHDEGLSLFC